ncbi:MAG: iron transporter [Lachnospiraceae bacterium]|nr:iron transporter [Lachnospiraceae bacterium]
MKRQLWMALLLTAACLGACGQAQETAGTTAAETAVETAGAEAQPSESVSAENAGMENVGMENVGTENAAADTAAEKAPIPDGEYVAEFHTDSTMFHINEVYEDKGTLTVENGKMTMHIVLPSKSIQQLYQGLAEDAQKEGAVLLDPVEESVTYPDGLTETVHAFDIPIPVLEEEFDLALIGTKEVWYDHKVSVSHPVPTEEAQTAGTAAGAEAVNEGTAVSAAELSKDGNYSIELALEGGSGKATVTSPAQIKVENGVMMLTVEWSSPNYDYMLLDGEKYLPVNTEGNSVFELPLAGVDAPLAVVADTVAMSTPHEVEYTIQFDVSTLKAE